MGIQSSAPSGKNPKRVMWDFDKMEPGRFFNAWLAGKCVGMYVHPRPSKPCCRVYSAGTLCCPGCDAGKTVEWFGYVPLYLETDERPTLVGIHEDAYPTVSGLTVHKLVIAMRGEKIGDTVCVRPAMKGHDRWAPQHLRDRCVDIEPSLFTMWRLPELQRYAQTHDLVADLSQLPGSAPSQEEQAAGKMLDKVKGSIMAHMLEQNGHKDRAAQVRRMIDGIGSGSNGTHPPPSD